MKAVSFSVPIRHFTVQRLGSLGEKEGKTEKQKGEKEEEEELKEGGGEGRRRELCQTTCILLCSYSQCTYICKHSFY